MYKNTYHRISDEPSRQMPSDGRSCNRPRSGTSTQRGSRARKDGRGYGSRSGELRRDPSVRFQGETWRWNTATAFYALVYVNNNWSRTTKVPNILALQEKERCGIWGLLSLKLLTLRLVLVMEIPVEDPQKEREKERAGLQKIQGFLDPFGTLPPYMGNRSKKPNMM